MNREERTHEYYERVLLHTDCKTAKGKPIKPIEYFDKVIPDGATNGDVIKAMFDVELVDDFCQSIGIKLSGSNYIQFNKDWLNAPYKRGGNNMSMYGESDHARQQKKQLKQ